MHNDDLPPGISAGNLQGPMTSEAIARYLPELDEIEISEEQKLELLGILYSIMRSFVELGFDVGAADIWGSISSEVLPGPSGTHTSEGKSDDDGAE